MEMDKDKFALLEKRMTEPMEGDHEAPQQRRIELKTLDPEPKNEYLPLNEDPKCPICHPEIWEPTEGDHKAFQQRRMELKTLDPEPKNEYLPLHEPVKDPNDPDRSYTIAINWTFIIKEPKEEEDIDMFLSNQDDFFFGFQYLIIQKERHPLTGELHQIRGFIQMKEPEGGLTMCRLHIAARFAMSHSTPELESMFYKQGGDYEEYGVLKPEERNKELEPRDWIQWEIGAWKKPEAIAAREARKKRLLKNVSWSRCE